MTRRTFCTVAGALAIAPSAMAVITFTDGVFNPADWTHITVVSGGGGTVTSVQQPTGGAPDEFLEVNNSVNGGGSSQVIGLHMMNSAVYDPSVGGAIDIASFRLDYRYITGDSGPGQGQAFGAVVSQSGFHYIALMGFTFGNTSWSTTGLAGFKPRSLNAINGGPGLDFSASGAPLNFGFYTANSTIGGAYFRTAGYDDFAVILEPIPAPGAATMFAVAALVGARRRRA